MAGIEQWLGAGAFALIMGGVTAYISYKQAVRVALTQAQAQIGTAQAQSGIERVKNEAALQNFFHEDAVEAKRDLKEERALHLECIEARAEAEAEVKRLSECLIDCRQERDEFERERDDAEQKWRLLDHENRNLETKLKGFDWIRDNPILLRARAEEIERERAQPNPPNQLPGGQ